MKKTNMSCGHWQSYTKIHSRMLQDVLNQVCVHLSLPAWGKLSRTNKKVKAALDTPLYWEGRYGGLKHSIIEGSGRLALYRSVDCHCIAGIWGDRKLTGQYMISLPVVRGVETPMFMRQLVEELKFLNHDFLPHMAQRVGESQIQVRLPTCPAPLGFHLAGHLRIVPFFFRDQTGDSMTTMENMICDLLQSVLEDSDDETRQTLDEIVEELEPDCVPLCAPPGGFCPDCGREFEDDGMGGITIVSHL